MEVSSKLKVLFIMPSLESGGLQVYLHRFLRLMKPRMDATVLVRSGESGDLTRAYEKLGITTIFRPLGYINPVKWWSYYRLFRKGGFESVCDLNANFAGIPMLLANLARIENRVAYYGQGKDHFRPGLIRNTYNRLMNRIVFRNATRILANSKAAMEFFFPYRKPEDDRFRVIYNGIDLNEFQVKLSQSDKTNMLRMLGIPEGAFLIGHVGRLDKAKNHGTILKVAQRLIQEDRNIYFLLCGPETEFLEKDVQELGILDNVRLLGFRKDIPTLLQIFDLFYFPSITESQPNALLEAMISGIPVVASNIEPIKEIIQDQTILFDPHDVENVSAHIRKMSLDPDSSASGRIDQGRLAQFSAGERFEDLFEELQYHKKQLSWR